MIDYLVLLMDITALLFICYHITIGEISHDTRIVKYIIGWRDDKMICQQYMTQCKRTAINLGKLGLVYKGKVRKYNCYLHSIHKNNSNYYHESG